MFYLLPPVFNFVMLMIPIFAFAVYDYFAFRSRSDYQALRERYVSYWRYRALAPKNPHVAVYVVQVAWALVLLVPIST